MVAVLARSPLGNDGTVKAQAQTVAGLTVTGVAPNESSARIYFQPVSGAKDYRVYDVAAPGDVKYAGLVHLSASSTCPGTSGCFNHFVTQSDGVTPVFPYQVASGASGGPQSLDVPATDIEWNGLADGQPHTLVVEAVNALGPVSLNNLYTGSDNVPMLSPEATGAMLGSDKGSTMDGKVSTNGQGPYVDNPQPIARSQPFVVQANSGARPLPSRSDAGQVFLDTFPQSEAGNFKQVSRSDSTTDSFGNLGQMTYTLNAGTAQAWTLEYRRADNENSMPFIAGDHFMDMLFDGATPNTSAPTHTIYGSMSMTPDQTLDITNGKVAHLTMEVDAHQSFRRWMAFDLAPANDPLQAWDPSGSAINHSDHGVFLELKDGFCTLDIYTGANSGSDPSPTGTAGGASHGSRLWGQAGSVGGAPVMCGWDQMYNPADFSRNGRGLDDRSRFDFYISQTHAALFQDGRLVVQSDIPAGSFGWSNQPLKAYYSHYLYHSDADLQDLDSFQVNGANICYPENSFWFNDPVNGTSAGQTICNTAYPPGYGFPHSDERHWDNMGFEVLPSSAAAGNGDFSGFASAVQPASPQPPQFVNGAGAPSTPTPISTSTATPTALATSTATPTVSAATATPIPTATATATPTSTQGTSASTTLGATSPGQVHDVEESNAITTSRVVTGSAPAIVTSISAYVGAVDAAPHNQFSVAIYADSNGSPSSLVAHSSIGTLHANTWNTLPISATLQPDTAYWLGYNTNGSTGSMNDMTYDLVQGNAGAYQVIGFGTWPSTFTPIAMGNWQFSIYATLAGAPSSPPATDTPTATATPTRPSNGGSPGQWANIDPPGVSLNPNSPPNNYGFGAVVVDPLAPNNLYVGTNYQGIWKSPDAGRTWAKIDTGAGGVLVDGGRNWTMAIDPSDSHVLYTTAGYGHGGVLKSTDGGVSWTDVFGSTSVAKTVGTADISTIRIDPFNHNHLIAAFHYYWGHNNGSGVIESTDAGASWVAHNPAWADPSNYVWFGNSSSQWIVGTQASGLWITNNSGATWTQFSTQSVAHGSDEGFYRDPARGTLIVLDGTSVLRSTNNGASWSDIGSGLPYAYYGALISDGTRLFTAPGFPETDNAAAHGPWYVWSLDGSTKWMAYNAQTTCDPNNGYCNGPTMGAYDAVNHILYSANWNAGLWKLQE